MIGKVNSLLQEFYFVSPSILMKLLNIYVTSFYGSSLWDLYSPEVTRIFSSWNVTVRNVFNLPWTTHRYLIEGVSGCVHPKTMLCSRLVKFLEGISSCSKSSVRYLASLVIDDRRTLTGRTLSSIARDCNVIRDSLTSDVARTLVYCAPTPEEQWRVPLLKELVETRCKNMDIPGFGDQQLSLMIKNVCIT